MVSWKSGFEEMQWAGISLSPLYREKLVTSTSEIICQVIIFAAKKETHS
jgi:hypothetical protein